jgi:aldose 1-epimerase
MGGTLGRFARCIAGGRFHIGDRRYQLDTNRGSHHFHGGTIGFDRFVWKGEAAYDGESLALHLRLARPDGDQGYPGAISAETIYRVDRDRRLTFEYRATTTASTIVAFTNHAYWNLGGSGTVDDHMLAINAGRVVAVDDELIPSGPPVPTAGSNLDYSVLRHIGSGSLDHCFLLDDPGWAAILFEPGSGREIRIRTDQPGLAVYSADALEQPRAGLALQTGALPDAPNRPDFPSARLDPGAIYTHHTTHEFSIRA